MSQQVLDYVYRRFPSLWFKYVDGKATKQDLRKCYEKRKVGGGESR